MGNPVNGKAAAAAACDGDDVIMPALNGSAARDRCAKKSSWKTLDDDPLAAIVALWFMNDSMSRADVAVSVLIVVCFCWCYIAQC